MKNIFIILIVFFSFPLVPVFPQPNDTIHLKEVHVVSSLLNVLQKQSGRSVSIITSEQIKQIPSSSIDELIRYIPGLEIQSRNLYGVQSDFSIRGSTFNQVLVMIDGIRLNDPLTGHFNSYFPVPLSEVSRIEVIRGPGTVMYGPDAVGGVINIITENYSIPEDSTRNFKLNIGGGQHGLFYTDAGIRQSYENWQFGGGFRLLSSSGFPGEGGFKDDFNLRTATLSTAVMVNERTRMFFRTAIDSREFSARRFYTISPFDTAREEVSAWWNHLGLVHTGEKSGTSMDVAFKTGSDNYLFNSLTKPNEHYTEQLLVQIRNNRNIGNALRFAYGLHGNYRAVVSNDRGNHNEFLGGIYSLAFLELPENVFLTGGIRLESDSYSQAMILPQLNLSWNKNKFTFRSLAGKTKRTPDFTERFVSTNLPSLASGRNLGNPMLTPESSWSFEAGMDVGPLPGFIAGFTVFSRFGNNLIDYILTPAEAIPGAGNLNPSGSYFFSRNIVEVRTGGIEITLLGKHSFGKAYELSYFGGFTLQSSESTGGELSKYISNQAKQLASFQALIKKDRAGFSLNGLYKQRGSEFAESIGVSLDPSYLLFNFQASYNIVPGMVSANIRIENLLDTEYADILGANLPGRWISIGGSVNL